MSRLVVTAQKIWKEEGMDTNEMEEGGLQVKMKILKECQFEIKTKTGVMSNLGSM
jgi:hypothetical protein